MRRLAILALLVVGGCTSTGPVPAGVPPAGAEELVFRLTELPGLTPPGGSFTLPRLSLYGGGLLVLGDAGPTRRQLTDAGIRRVVQAAADAGLTGGTDYGTPRLADAGAAVFTVVTTTRRTTKVTAPSVDDGLTAAQREARGRLRSFMDELSDLDAWLGGEIGEPEPYPYTRLAVLALPRDPGSPERQWPLADPATAGAPHGTGRCQIVSGTDLPRIRAAPPDTVWRGGSGLFQVVLRPLLPDERTCQDLRE